jgi:membrane associated rhomboid family serine protease
MPFSLQYNSPVVLSFSIVAIAVFALDKLLSGTVMPLFTLYPSFDSTNFVSYFRLVSHPFGHVSIDHLWGNLTFLLLLGPVIEEKYGSIATLFMILVTTVATAILHILLFNNGLLGASGIVFMFIILVSFTNVQTGKIPLTFIIITVLFLGREFYNSLNPNDTISQFAHIVGGVFGGIFGLVLNNKNARPQSNY